MEGGASARSRRLLPVAHRCGRGAPVPDRVAALRAGGFARRADPECASLPRRPRRRHHARRAHRLRRPGRLRDGHDAARSRWVRSATTSAAASPRCAPRCRARPRPPRGCKAFSREVMRRVGLGLGSRGESVSVERFQESRARRRRGARRHAAAARSATASRSRTPGTSRSTRAPGAASTSSAAWAAATTSSSCSTTAQRLWVMFHTGSRGFGHGLASYYFELAQEELGLARGRDGPRLLPAGVAALARLQATPWPPGGNYRDRQPADDRPRRGRGLRGDVFGSEAASSSTRSATTWCRRNATRISSSSPVWIHRKGATRALPAGHPMLAGHALGGRPGTRS